MSHENFHQINAVAEEEDPSSVLRWYRRLGRLRKEVPVLIYGDYREVMPENREIFGFERFAGEERAVILINFSDKDVDYPEELVERMKFVMGSQDGVCRGRLRAYEAVCCVRDYM